jgi:hypothetical protein
MQFKKTDLAGRALVVTETAKPTMAKDDLRAGPLILNAELDYGLGAPEIVVTHGRGFGYRIPHRVLDEDEKKPL